MSGRPSSLPIRWWSAPCLPSPITPSVNRLLGAATVSSPSAEDGIIVGNANVAAVAAALFTRSGGETEDGLCDDMAALLAVVWMARERNVMVASIAETA